MKPWTTIRLAVIVLMSAGLLIWGSITVFDGKGKIDDTLESDANANAGRTESGDSGSGELYLVKDRQARSVIVRQIVGAKGVRNEAIQELQRDIKKATGVELPIVTDDEAAALPQDTVRILVGFGRYAESLGITTSGMDNEVYRVARMGNHLVLAGNGNDANLWAVAYFLDRYLNVKWLWPGELGTYVPQSSTIALPDVDVTLQPQMERRQPNVSPLFPPDGVYWLHVHQMGEQKQRAPYPVRHAFGDWWSKYGAEHPEYFAQPPTGQKPVQDNFVKLDIGNPVVDDAIIKEWREAGAPDYWNVAPNDGAGFCVSEACLAMDTPSGQSIEDIWTGKANLTARYVRFWNRLLDKMREINPKVQLATFAYSAYREPPPPDLNVHEGIVIGYIHSYWSYESWKGWKDAGVTLYLRPNWWYQGAVAPHLPLHEEGNFFKYAYENGMTGFYFDSLIGNWGTQGPLYYLIARLAERPALSVDDAIDEYCSAFGQAASAIRRYLDYWEKFSDEVAYSAPAGGAVSHDPNGKYETLIREYKLPANPLPGSYYTLPYIYTDDVLAQARTILDEADKAAANDGEDVKARIAFLRDGLRHLELTREVVRYGFGKTRPEGATEDEYDRLREQLLAFRKEIAARNVVWDKYLNNLESSKNYPTVPGGAAAWRKSPMGNTTTDIDKEYEGQ